MAVPDTIPPARIPGWAGADMAPALLAFRRSAPAILASRDAGLDEFGVGARTLRPAAEAVLAGEGGADPRGFFERFFRARPIRGEGERDGFLTGYYEPEIEASRHPTRRFATPLLRRPADLARVEDARFPEGFARRAPDGTLSAYPDRARIERDFLEGQGLEIAWVADPVDAFFVHVQGSARLALTDGGTLRVGFAAKNGHRFTAIGRVLVARGELALAEADMAGIRRWLAAAPPDAARALLHENRSFIFFREMPAGEPGAGPVGAAGVALTPLASLAVDGRLHRYGAPVFVAAPGLRLGAEPFARLLVAQDTGSAIRGPARGDLFVGSGEEAGRLAGAIRHDARFHLLVPHGDSR